MHPTPDPELLPTLLATARGTDPAALRAAGRLMTLLENDPGQLPALWRAAGTRLTLPARLLGVTGAPGCGKSTLVDAMVAEYRRRWPQERVGVVAVDPSSPFSGGAILGDRVRMMRHALDPMVFVRSLASRGELGGLATGVKGVLHVMGAVGIGRVIVETVGVGQSEVDIARLADDVLVVLAPGQGDGVQLLKAGLMEIGDTVVINKCDRPGADELHAQVLAALQLEPAPTPRHVAQVSALEQRGIAELVDATEARAAAQATARLARREETSRRDLREAVLAAARRRLVEAMGHDNNLRLSWQRLEEGALTAGEFVSELLALSARAEKDHPHG